MILLDYGDDFYQEMEIQGQNFKEKKATPLVSLLSI